MIKPKVTTKAGHIIEPMDRDQLVKRGVADIAMKSWFILHKQINFISLQNVSSFAHALIHQLLQFHHQLLVFLASINELLLRQFSIIVHVYLFE